MLFRRRIIVEKIKEVEKWVNIVNFSCFPDKDRYHNAFHICEDETHQVLNDDLEIHFLELPKLLYHTGCPQTRLEKWLLYLNNAEGEQMEEVAMSEPMIKKALTCEQIFTKNAQERRRYELREKAIMEEQTLLHGARAEGMAEGMAEGEVKGKLDIARKLLLRGHTAEDIANLTELTVAQVQTLAKERPQ